MKAPATFIMSCLGRRPWSTVSGASTYSRGAVCSPGQLGSSASRCEYPGQFLARCDSERMKTPCRLSFSLRMCGACQRNQAIVAIKAAPRPCRRDIIKLVKLAATLAEMVRRLRASR